MYPFSKIVERRNKKRRLILINQSLIEQKEVEGYMRKYPLKRNQSEM